MALLMPRVGGFLLCCYSSTFDISLSATFKLVRVGLSQYVPNSRLYFGRHSLMFSLRQAFPASIKSRNPTFFLTVTTTAGWSNLRHRCSA